MPAPPTKVKIPKSSNHAFKAIFSRFKALYPLAGILGLKVFFIKKPSKYKGYSAVEKKSLLRVLTRIVFLSYVCSVQLFNPFNTYYYEIK